jgi:dephospho-CoA kinase
MELAERENLQMPLDKKREMSDHVIVNTADTQFIRGQVRDVLSRILAGSTAKPSPQ